ncbi:MAG: hypothetical protein E7348_05135 [Clostridiales bacterium]|nr:hypothetical protein [Clostridiales bacterium]
MVDIHTHILPNIDDGSQSVESSLSMVQQCVEQGVTDIVLTPHYRGEYKYDKQTAIDSFENFKLKVKEKGLDVNLYLGQEIFIEPDYKRQFKEDTFLTIANGKYVLIEFAYTGYIDAPEIVYEIIRLGYKPIIAHVERYDSIELKDVVEIKELGGYIQVNASSLVNMKIGKVHKKAKILLRCGLVDFVASDVHENRKNNLLKASKYVEKKFGKYIKDKLFTKNAKKIIEG